MYIAPHVHKWSPWYPSEDYAVYVAHGPRMQWRACRCGRVQYRSELEGLDQP